MTPRQFRTLPPDDRAELHAHYTINQEIEAYFECEKAKAYDRITNTDKRRRRV